MKVFNYQVLVSQDKGRMYKQKNLLQIGYEINIQGNIKMN